MAYIDLAVCYGEEIDSDGTLEWTLADMIKGAAVTTEVIEEHSSSGGWPTVRFTGDKMDIEPIVRGYAHDEADTAYHMTFLVED